METKQITAEYIDHMGSDLSVVNAARASFGKDSTWEQCSDGRRKLKPADANLIRFLATGYRTSEWDAFLDQIIVMVSDMVLKGTLDTGRTDLTTLLHAYKNKAQHWAPFAHPHITIRIQIPLFLARQFVKHQVGGVWSEESRRYISDTPEVWFPEQWHTRPEDIKQGSGELVECQSEVDWAARTSTDRSIDTYKNLLDWGTAPEEARIVLPLNTMTTVVWTGSLLFWARVRNLRADSHAQLAAQELAKLITGIIQPLYPVSWDALT